MLKLRTMNKDINDVNWIMREINKGIKRKNQYYIHEGIQRKEKDELY